MRHALPSGTALPASAAHFDVPLPAVAISTGPPVTFIEMLGLLNKAGCCELKPVLKAPGSRFRVEGELMAGWHIPDFPDSLDQWIPPDSSGFLTPGIGICQPR